MYSNLNIKKIILMLLYAAALVWLILLGFEWGSTYFENQKQAAYEEVPFELKLKAAPKDVIYSEAYATESGTQIVKYAYLTDEVSPIPDEDISRRTPVSQTVVLDTFKNEEGKDMEKLKTTFLSKPQMYQDNGKWRQIEYATTTAEVFSMSGAIPVIKRREFAERLIPGESVFATVSTFYPDANTETTSVDGYASQSAMSTDNLAFSFACSISWDNAQPGLGDSSSDSGTILFVAASSATVFTGPDNYECTIYIYRSVVLFDTSGLPDTAVISNSVLGLYATSKVNNDNDGSDSVNIVSSAPASNTAVVNGDYDSLGTTLYASAVDIGSITTSAYNSFSFNGTGIAAVSKTGISKFGVREGHDLNNDIIADGFANELTFSSADQTGTTQDPKLDVTYTTGSFSIGDWFPF